MWHSPVTSLRSIDIVEDAVYNVCIITGKTKSTTMIVEINHTIVAVKPHRGEATNISLIDFQWTGAETKSF